LIGRKRILRRLDAADSVAVPYVEHLERRGCDLFRDAYRRGQERIVRRRLGGRVATHAAGDGRQFAM